MSDDDPSDGYDSITAQCDLCGEEHVGVGTPVLLIFPGMIFPNLEFDVAMFVPDPDVKFRVIQLPNGTLGLVTDESLTKYAHSQCYIDLVEQAAYMELEDEFEEDEDE